MTFVYIYNDSSRVVDPDGYDSDLEPSPGTGPTEGEKTGSWTDHQEKNWIRNQPAEKPDPDPT